MVPHATDRYVRPVPNKSAICGICLGNKRQGTVSRVVAIPFIDSPRKVEDQSQKHRSEARVSWDGSIHGQVVGEISSSKF